MFENVPHRTLGKCQNQNGVHISERSKKIDHERLSILHFRTKRLPQLMNLELRKERKEKKVLKGKNILFIVILFVLLKS